MDISNVMRMNETKTRRAYDYREEGENRLSHKEWEGLYIPFGTSPTAPEWFQMMLRAEAIVGRHMVNRLGEVIRMIPTIDVHRVRAALRQYPIVTEYRMESDWLETFKFEVVWDDGQIWIDHGISSVVCPTLHINGKEYPTIFKNESVDGFRGRAKFDLSAEEEDIINGPTLEGWLMFEEATLPVVIHTFECQGDCTVASGCHSCNKPFASLDTLYQATVMDGVCPVNTDNVDELRGSETLEEYALEFSVVHQQKDTVSAARSCTMYRHIAGDIRCTWDKDTINIINLEDRPLLLEEPMRSIFYVLGGALDRSRMDFKVYPYAVEQHTALSSLFFEPRIRDMDKYFTRKEGVTVYQDHVPEVLVQQTNMAWPIEVANLFVPWGAHFSPTFPNRRTLWSYVANLMNGREQAAAFFYKSVHRYPLDTENVRRWWNLKAFVFSARGASVTALGLTWSDAMNVAVQTWLRFIAGKQVVEANGFTPHHHKSLVHDGYVPFRPPAELYYSVIVVVRMFPAEFERRFSLRLGTTWAQLFIMILIELKMQQAFFRSPNSARFCYPVYCATRLTIEASAFDESYGTKVVLGRCWTVGILNCESCAEGVDHDPAE